MKYLAVFLGVIFLGGCLTRTYIIEKPRVDTTIEGNQGYLFGTPSEASKEKKFRDTRTISVLEVELGSHPAPKSKAEKETVSSVESLEEEKIEAEEEYTEEAVPSEKSYQSYTIQNGDTLQKISQKFYGTTKKWKMLYEENKDVLKGPDKILPGKTIKIPVLN